MTIHLPMLGSIVPPERGEAEGCIQCQQGSKLVLFVTGKCHWGCDYCPLSDNRRETPFMFANEKKCESWEEVIQEAEAMQATGTGITGGDPMLDFEKTVEAIQHAKAANVPIIVAINKSDLPNSQIGKIKDELMRYELVAESLGGETLFVEVSAKNKTNLDKLKETIILQSEILDLKAPKDGNAKAIVLEAKIDKGKGPVSTILITGGKLKKGNYFVCGNTWGKIRAMIDFNGKIIDEANPSCPVEILGMNESANAGDEFLVVNNEEEAKQINSFRKTGSKDKNILSSQDKTNIFENQSTKKELNIVLKSDVQGSSEALKNAINKIEHSEVKPKIILSDIGMINETDVSLAKASNAIVIGFNIKPNREAKRSADQQKIRIEFFNIN